MTSLQTYLARFVLNSQLLVSILAHSPFHCCGSFLFSQCDGILSYFYEAFSGCLLLTIYPDYVSTNSANVPDVSLLYI